MTTTLGIDLLYLIAYLSMGALPQVFFRKDGRRFNAMWWCTASPYIVAPTLVLLQRLGVVGALVDVRSPLGHGLAIASVPFAAAAIALMYATMASHRAPLALWHQSNDAPQRIVTWGPYARVRHPFYASFLLLTFGTALLSVQIGTMACFLASLLVMTVTARREEQRLLRSSFGEEYATYLQRTWRFLPRLRAARS